MMIFRLGFFLSLLLISPTSLLSSDRGEIEPLTSEQERELQSFGNETGISVEEIALRLIRCRSMQSADVVECAKSLPTPVWFVEFSTDPITDQVTAAAMQTNKSGEVILIGCKEEESFIILTSDSQVSNSFASVIVRIDKTEPVESTWRRSGNGYGVLARGDQATDLIKLASRGVSLVTRVEVRSGTETSMFDVGTFREEAERVFEACDW